MGLNESNGNMVMPVGPMYGNGGANGWNGNDWWVILFLFALMGNWGNGFGGGNGSAGSMLPYFTSQNTDAAVQRGFDQSAVTGQLAGIQTSLTTGFANAEVANCNRTINSLERSFDAQTAVSGGISGIASQLAQCCCENRLASADLKYTIATENCADRAALSDGIRDLLAATQAQTQTILDKMCQDKLDQKNDEIGQLRQELLYARGQASQVAQNSTIINGVYDRLNQCPVGTVPVYGEQPIFTCPNNSFNGGCGCGCNG